MNELPEYEPSEELKTVIMPAIDRARERIQNVREWRPGYWHEGPNVTDCVIYRARLDWEIEDSAVNDALADNALREMYVMAAGDLDDVLQNGDRSRPNDPLLSLLDGSKKRGKKLKSFDVVEQTLWVQHVEKKKTYEYTLWVNFTAEWE